MEQQAGGHHGGGTHVNYPVLLPKCQVTEGESVELVCSVTVGQQYNTVSMLPVYADWDWERWVQIKQTY